MSIGINVFLSRDTLPEAGEWQEQIRSLGFSLMIDTDFALQQFSGFLPCRLNGEQVGFEYSCDPLEDTMFDPEDPDVAARLGGRETCVGFSASTAGGDIAAAVIASACLAKMCGGVLWAIDEFVLCIDPIEWANASISQLSS